MSAKTFTTVVRPASVFSTEKKKCGSAPLTSAAVTALGALTASSTRNDVLDIIRDLEIADRAVGTNSIGGASSTLN